MLDTGCISLDPETQSFKETQEWIAWGYLDPGRMVQSLQQKLNEARKKQHKSVQLRVNLMLEQMARRFEARITSRPGTEPPAAFQQLLHFSRGVRDDIHKKSSAGKWFKNLPIVQNPDETEIKRKSLLLIPQSVWEDSGLSRTLRGRRRPDPVQGSEYVCIGGRGK